ncbi:MAG: hypothetical protein HOV80_23880 [Polyangiaceae bacterium]|nr:hypothetical protein [Polyangiaceae bacterium]
MVKLSLSFAALAGLALVAGCLQDFEQFRGEGGSGGTPTTTTQTTTVQSSTASMMCDPATCPGPDTDCTNPVCNSGACAIGNEPQGAACADGDPLDKVCDGAGNCVECNGDPDCTAPTPICDGGLCVAEHCQNMMLDMGLETDIDCGGTDCPPCENGLGCMMRTDCVSGFCMGTSCAACGGDGDCDAATQWCNSDTNGGTCEAKKPDGQTCDGGNECTNGNCVDGFCCGSASCNECQSCNIPGMEGTCNNDPGGTSCNDGQFCTMTDTCDGAGTCNGTGNPCPGADGDGDCSESCNEGADDCSGNDPNGSACNDGQFCTVTDSCNNGTCSGTGDPCPGPDGDGDCSESCNEASNDCTLNDPNLSACNDGTFCNGADTCNASGSCANHAGNPCPGADGDGDCSESCNEGADDCSANDPNNSACNDGLFCNGTDTCNNSGACNNHTGNPCPGHNMTPSCDDSCSETNDNCTGFDATGTTCNENGMPPNGTCDAAGTCTND